MYDRDDLSYHGAAGASEAAYEEEQNNKPKTKIGKCEECSNVSAEDGDKEKELILVTLGEGSRYKDWCCRDCEDGVIEMLQDAAQMDQEDMHNDPDYYMIDGVGFADPGGGSALRAETRDNPRNLPCPTCGRENMLTPLDRRAGYQCDFCADAAEDIGGY